MLKLGFKYKTSFLKVPKDDIDRLNVRDNLKLAMEAEQKDQNKVLLAAGKGMTNYRIILLVFLY